MDARLRWCQQYLAKKDTLFGRSTNTVVIHVDEKWFRLFLLKRLLYLPSNVRRGEAVQHVMSKTQIPKVMFLAAVGFPR